MHNDDIVFTLSGIVYVSQRVWGIKPPRRMALLLCRVVQGFQFECKGFVLANLFDRHEPEQSPRIYAQMTTAITAVGAMVLTQLPSHWRFLRKIMARIMLENTNLFFNSYVITIALLCATCFVVRHGDTSTSPPQLNAVGQRVY